MTPASPGQRSIRDAIADEESQLLRLETELIEARARLAALKSALGAQRGSIQASSSAPSTAVEKVALFRSRFRGRADIYPRFWTNARTGRKGYAPACGNEWVRGVCEKPRVKCGECPNQAFLPVEDRVILDHLQGRHVVGVYPLLEARKSSRSAGGLVCDRPSRSSTSPCRIRDRRERNGSTRTVIGWAADSVVLPFDTRA